MKYALLTLLLAGSLAALAQQPPTEGEDGQAGSEPAAAGACVTRGGDDGGRPPGETEDPGEDPRTACPGDEPGIVADAAEGAAAPRAALEPPAEPVQDEDVEAGEPDDADFQPDEEISEDYPVPLPSDI